MSTSDLKAKVEAIRERHAAATRGPWYWHGYLGSHNVSLHGRPGMASVMEFRRWGMQSAQPLFCTGGILQTVEEVAAPDTTPGRGRVTDINHPDARFIASAWQDVADLLARVAELEAVLAESHRAMESLQQKLIEANNRAATYMLAAQYANAVTP